MLKFLNKFGSLNLPVMKNLITACLIFCSTALAYSQVSLPVVDSPEYQQQKLNGTLNGYLPGPPAGIIPGNTSGVFGPGQSGVQPQSSSCDCYTPSDGSWSTLTACDDCSSPAITLPFNFCLYGSYFNVVYINNNGNISFGSSYGTFTPVVFPNSNFIMVAPFWADVDTRGGLGQVRYKITPTALYVNWENVGYYNTNGDKRNTFSAILTDGNDSVVGIGNNVGFCYVDMEWTTGNASQGSNGFGGSPAIVGANWGNGVNFNMIGRFNSPGTTYFGPNATNNQVSWLDNKSFKFNVCNSVNVPPVLVAANVPGYTFVGDTCNAYLGGTLEPNSGPPFSICVGSTTSGSLTFTGPEQNQTVTITATGPPGFTYTNTPGGTSVINYSYTPPPGTTGFQTFTVTATDNGVPIQSTTITFGVNVTAPPYNPTISGPDSICTGGTATLTINENFTTYQWVGPASSNQQSVTGPQGTYNVLVTINGCSLQTSKTVYLYSNPNPVITGDSLVCENSSSLLSTTIPYVSYSWSTGDSSSTTLAPAGSHTVTVVDNNGCTGTSAPFVITNYAPFITNKNITNISCIGMADGEIEVIVPGATGSETIQWDHDPNLSSFTATGLGVGTYKFTFTDPNGCTWPDSATVGSPSPLINVLNITDVTCPGGSDGKATVVTSGGTNPYTYEWSHDINNTSNIGTGFVLGNYSVTINDANGCNETINFSIGELSTTPTLSFSSIIESCPGASNGSIDLTVSGGTPNFTFLWSNGDTNEDPTGLAQGTYSVTVYDQNACPFTGSTTVGVGDNIELTSIANDIPCFGDATGSIVFNPQTGIAPFTVFLNGVQGSLNNQHLPAGTYNISITDVNGCYFNDVITLTQPPQLIVDSVIYNINLGDVITVPINAVGGVQPYIYNWVPTYDVSCTSCTNPIITAVNTTNYTIEVTDANGCVAYGQAIINVNQMPPLIPSSFTPNGDGLNDELLVLLSGVVEFQITIFDRWGEKVFESSDIYKGWDGTMRNGKAAPSGSYVYRIQGKLISGTDLNEFGNVILIR